MKYYFCALIIISITLSSCVKNVKQISDNRTDKEIDSLIQHHKDDLIFLSFWENMSETDFKRVVAIENKNGNLSDGKFNFTINGSSIAFDVEQLKTYISLRYKDEYLIDKNTNNIRVTGNSEYYAYQRIAEKLNKHFDSKYERKIIPNLTEDKRRDFFGNLLNPPLRIWESSIDNKRVFWMGESIWYNNKEGFSFSPHYRGDKELLASCSILITVKSYETFIKEREEKEKEELLQKEEKELKKKNIKIHNDIL